MDPKSIRMKSMDPKLIGMVCELNVVVGGEVLVRCGNLSLVAFFLEIRGARGCTFHSNQEPHAFATYCKKNPYIQVFVLF